MKLGKLPRILPGIHPPVADELADIEITGITHDSRRVQAGFVFVAIPGHLRDGGDFADDAAGRGAVAVVSEKPLRLQKPVVQFIVQDARRSLAALANTFFNKPSRKLQVIGVTGTNGKTTTTYMIRSILEHAGQRCGVIGTINYDTGRRVVSSSITTPESVDIQEYLAEMVAEGMEAAAMEVSSHSLCMRRVDFVQFAVGVFTNLSPEHMDYHRTIASYRDAKCKLFSGLGPASLAVLNSDDEHSDHIQSATFAKVIRYGLKHKADVSAEVRKSTLDGTHMLLRSPAGEVEIYLPFIGVHNVYNALASATVALALGHELSAVRNGLEHMPIVPGRLEPVPYQRGCKVLVDFAHTDQALKSVLESLRPIAQKKIIVVFGAGGDRDREKRPRMGRVVEQHADVAWVTSDNPRGEEPMNIIEEIVAGMKNKRAVHVQPDREAAINEALRHAEDGDLVLIAGKGHERTQRFSHTVIPFDDREVVKRAAGNS